MVWRCRVVRLQQLKQSKSRNRDARTPGTRAWLSTARLGVFGEFGDARGSPGSAKLGRAAGDRAAARAHAHAAATRLPIRADGVNRVSGKCWGTQQQCLDHKTRRPPAAASSGAAVLGGSWLTMTCLGQEQLAGRLTSTLPRHAWAPQIPSWPTTPQGCERQHQVGVSGVTDTVRNRG